MTYVPRSQPPQLSRRARERWHEIRDAEARRDALFAEAVAMLAPYAASGEPLPAHVLAAFQAKEQAAKAVKIPDYL